MHLARKVGLLRTHILSSLFRMMEEGDQVPPCPLLYLDSCASCRALSAFSTAVVSVTSSCSIWLRTGTGSSSNIPGTHRQAWELWFCVSSIHILTKRNESFSYKKRNVIKQTACGSPHLWVFQHSLCVSGRSECIVAPQVSPNLLHDHPCLTHIKTLLADAMLHHTIISYGAGLQMTLTPENFLIHSLQSQQHLDNIHKILHKINPKDFFIQRSSCSFCACPPHALILKPKIRLLYLGLKHLTFGNWIAWRLSVNTRRILLTSGIHHRVRWGRVAPLGLRITSTPQHHTQNMI